jgi:hypothetical protein
MTSYRYEVQVAGRWYPNSVYFATREEADAAAASKLWNWTQAEDTRVVESDEPANYRWDADRGAIHIATENTGA